MSAAATQVQSTLEKANDIREVLTGPRIPHNARTGSGLVVDAGNGIIAMADAAGFGGSVPQPLRDGLDLLGQAKSINPTDTAIGGLPSIKVKKKFFFSSVFFSHSDPFPGVRYRQ